MVRLSRSGIIAALLVGVLGLIGMLGWQAWAAARARRAVAQAALRDYAAFGASEFARRSRDAISNASLYGPLYPALGVSGTTPRRVLPPPTLLQTPPARTPTVDLRPAITAWFRLVLADTEIRTAGETPSPAVQRWLREAVPAAIRELQSEGGYFAIVAGAPDGAPRVAAFVMRADSRMRPSVAYGFVMPAGGLAPAFRAVLAASPLLPRADAPLPNDSALAVEVTMPAGPTIFSTGPMGYGAAREPLGARFGGLIARVVTRPESASRFVTGGVPPLPYTVVPLAGAVILAAALLAVALLQLRREAELSRLRDAFVAGVSHELRTPLTQIRLFAETLLLGRARDDVERRRALEIIHAESRRLSHIVENLLQFSRASRPAAALDLETIALAPLVRDVAGAFAPLAATRSMRVALELDEPALVRADRAALRQMVLNLLDNTLKFGPAGQVVAVRVSRTARGVTIAVEDQGPGIAARDGERVFERFARLPAARGTTGAGLGLAVVRELATQLAGRVWVEEAPAGGARFVLELPAAT